MREFSQYREVAPFPTPSLSLSFIVSNLVSSSFLPNEGFIVRALRHSGISKNFPVFTKRIASRTQPHITRLEDGERNARGKRHGVRGGGTEHLSEEENKKKKEEEE